MKHYKADSFKTRGESGVKRMYYKKYFLSTKVRRGRTVFGPSHIKYSFTAPVTTHYYTENGDLVSKSYGNDLVNVEFKKVDEVRIYFLTKDANGVINSKPVWDESIGLDPNAVYEDIHAGEKAFDELISQLHENVFLITVIKYFVYSFLIIIFVTVWIIMGSMVLGMKR